MLRPEPQPRPTTIATIDTADPSECGDIVDRATGLPRVVDGKCPTCIFRPGNLMHLDAGRREGMVRAALGRGSWIVCHATLPAAGTPCGEQAICRGFWDVHARDSFGCRLAVALGGPEFVPLTASDGSAHPGARLDLESDEHGADTAPPQVRDNPGARPDCASVRVAITEEGAG